VVEVSALPLPVAEEVGGIGSQLKELQALLVA
jgi:hypothetical protein